MACSPWAFQHSLSQSKGTWGFPKGPPSMCSPAMFVITIHHKINLPLFLWRSQQSKTLLQLISHSHCCESEVNKIFKSKRRETQSAADIKLSANTHCSNLFTWDGGKALREVWPGSNYAHSGVERACCLALAVSTYREESNHWRQTSLDLCWWLTRTSGWLLV